MKFVLLALFIGIIALAAWFGFRNGFLKTIVSMAAIILSILAVYLFSSKITQLIDNNTGLRSAVQETVYDKLQEKMGSNKNVSDEDQKEAVSSSGFLPESILEDFEEAVNPFGSNGDYATRLSAYVGELAVKACGILATLLVTFIVLKIVLMLSGLINKVPLLGLPNKIGGAALGVFRGLIIIWIICFVITALSSTSIGHSCLEAIADSKLLSLFYNGVLSFDGLTSLL